MARCRILLVLSVLYYGVKSTPRRTLVGIEKHPYVVSVQEQNQHKCNGVILSKSFILTSGHCLDKHMNAYSILAGGDDLSSPFQAIRALVLHFSGHEEVEYDIGLMQLKDHLNFTENIQPIEIPRNREKVPSPAHLVGFGSFRQSRSKDRLRVLTAIINETSEACDKENLMEFCVGQYTRADSEQLPQEDTNKAANPAANPAKDPKWLETDRQEPFEWTSSKRAGMNRRTMYREDKNLEILENKGSGIMNDFAIGTPLVKNGVLYGILSSKDGDMGIMTSIPMFVKYLKSSVFDLPESKRARTEAQAQSPA